MVERMWPPEPVWDYDPLTSSGTLGNLPSFSQAQCPHTHYAGWLWRSNESVCMKHLTQSWCSNTH